MAKSTESLFEPVWVSSHAHLDQFQQIRDPTPWYRYLTGGYYDVPATFPSLTFDAGRIPLVYLSSGALTIGEAVVAYTARSYSGTELDRRRRNLDTSLQFSMDRAEHLTLRRFRKNAPWLSYFSINWIEIALPSFTRPVLLCAGATGPGMGRLRHETDSLFDALVRWVRKPTGHQSR